MVNLRLENGHFVQIAAHMAEAEENCLWKRIRLIATGTNHTSILPEQPG